MKNFARIITYRFRDFILVCDLLDTLNTTGEYKKFIGRLNTKVLVIPIKYNIS